jgi:hypothetical protein
MTRSLRIIIYGNAVIIVAVATYFFLWPAAILTGALRDPALGSSKVPRFALQLHRSISDRIGPWAQTRVESGRAAQLNFQNVSGTEWPVFSSAFYLWATEALQESWEQDRSTAPIMPKQYARGAIERVAALISDPGHGGWVRKWWGNDYLKHDNLFYRMLLISGLTSYQKLTANRQYETLLRDQVEGLSSEMDASPFGLLDDYPGQCYPVDVLTAVAAIQRADSVLGTDHSAFTYRARRAFESARLDAETGLPAWIADSKTGLGQGSARGVGLAFMLIWAAKLWPQTAEGWYQQFEKHF